MKVHHIGYAVKNLEQSIAAFEALGYSSGAITADAGRKIRIAFLRNGSECVELVAPDGDESPVDGVLKSIGPTPYHICYEVPDMESALAELQHSRWIVTKQAEPAPAIGGARVAFLYHRRVGMIELVELK